MQLPRISSHANLSAASKQDISYRHDTNDADTKFRWGPTMHFARTLIHENPHEESTDTSSILHSLLTQNRIPAGRKQAEFVANWFQFNMSKLSAQMSHLHQQNAATEDKENQGANASPATSHTLNINLAYYKQVEALIEHAMLEIIRQVAIGCAERGNFLALLWMRLKDLVNRLIHLIQYDLKSYHQRMSEAQQSIEMWRTKYLDQEDDTRKQLVKRDFKLRDMEADTQRLELSVINQNKKIEVLQRQREAQDIKLKNSQTQIEDQNTQIAQLEDNIKDLLVEEMENKHELEKLRPIAVFHKAQMHEIEALRTQNEHLKAQLRELQDYKTQNEINKRIEEEYVSSHAALMQKLESKLEHTEELLRKEQDRHAKTKAELVQERQDRHDKIRWHNDQEVQVASFELAGSEHMQTQTDHSGELIILSPKNSTKRDGAGTNNSRASRKRQTTVPKVLKPYFQKQTHYAYTPLQMTKEAMEHLILDLYQEKLQNDELDMQQYGSRMTFPEFIYLYFYELHKQRSSVAEKRILDLCATMEACTDPSAEQSVELFSKLSGIDCASGKISALRNTAEEVSRDEAELQDTDQTNANQRTHFTPFSTDALVVFLSCLNRITKQRTLVSHTTPLSTIRLTTAEGRDILESYLSFLSAEDMNSVEEELFVCCERPTSRSVRPTTPFQPATSQMSVDVCTFALRILCKYWDLFVGGIWKRIEEALRTLEREKHTLDAKKKFIWRYSMFSSLLSTDNETEHQQQVYKKLIERRRSMETTGATEQFTDDVALFCNVVREEWGLRMQGVDVQPLLNLEEKLKQESQAQTKGRIFSTLWEGKVETFNLVTPQEDMGRNAEHPPATDELDKLLRDAYGDETPPTQKSELMIKTPRQMNAPFTPSQMGRKSVGVVNTLLALARETVQQESPEHDELQTEGDTALPKNPRRTNSLTNSFEYVSPFGGGSKQKKLIVIPTGVGGDPSIDSLKRKKHKRKEPRV